MNYIATATFAGLVLFVSAFAHSPYIGVPVRVTVVEKHLPSQQRQRSDSIECMSAFEGVNRIYNSTAEQTIGGYGSGVYSTPTNVWFYVVEVRHVADTILYDGVNASPDEWQYMNELTSSADSVIDIVLTMRSNTNSFYGSGHNGKGAVVYNWQWGEWLSRTLAHELGHALFLTHTFGNYCGGSDYIQDTPEEPCNCMIDPGPNCTNNFMGYNQHPEFMSATQAYYIRRALLTDSVYVNGADMHLSALAWAGNLGVSRYARVSHQMSTEEHKQGAAMYPNPTSGVLHVPGNGAMVFDLFGRLVMRVDGVTTVDLSGLPDGVYVVRSGGMQKKVIKNLVAM